MNTNNSKTIIRLLVIAWSLWPELVLAFNHNKHIVRQRNVCLQAAFNAEDFTYSTRTEILYEKIIAPSDAVPEILFFGKLVEYLEHYFELPTDLPMEYKAYPREDRQCLLVWDSPISPVPSATRMEISVVDLYKESQETMAMVSVSKSRDPYKSLPPLMESLFTDSEKKIFRALDRGLDDFILGRINVQNKEPEPKPEPKPPRTSSGRTAQPDIIDAEIVTDIEEEEVNTYFTQPITASKTNSNRYQRPKLEEDKSFFTRPAPNTKGNRYPRPGSRYQRPKLEEKTRAADMAGIQLQNSFSFNSPVTEDEAPDEAMEQEQLWSPSQDLLDDVLNFVEEETTKNSEGEGFVSGAFEKAKELIQESYQRRASTRRSQQMGSDEEEMRRIFQAGEKIANEQVCTFTQLDVFQELYEIEEYIYQPPEEGSGVLKIVSGVPIFSSNSRKAVDCPEAWLKTKRLDLPEGLNVAVRQAEFSIKVLSDMLFNLKTVERNSYDGSISVHYYAGVQELTQGQVENIRKVVAEATELGLLNDWRLQKLLNELWEQPETQFLEITENYKDLFLSDKFAASVKERLNKLAKRQGDSNGLKESDEREKELLGKLVVHAQVLLKGTWFKDAELEAQHLEVVRSICNVAMDPRHTTEGEIAAALKDTVCEMRALLDDDFAVYVDSAVIAEKAQLASGRLLSHQDHNQWFSVLQIVQKGVHAEITAAINRYVEHIWYVVRMETPEERRRLLEKLINDMPAVDVRPFVQAVENIVGSLDDGAQAGALTSKLRQLHRDVKELLPPNRIGQKGRDADSLIATQRKRLLEARRIGDQ